ncbi:hypothetical protein CYMTET_40153 [Cymbomonas tetramitiformis]|uniref:Uncharacterized protein n=1 Tax=Cymbomonas tetramitiformis TaxID=36881 RepID=A0AAE0C8M0_9CHLO|nr:hypothetical protein CYMTET_40153 [Cymbomonas tetramitiformis]
MPGGSDNIVHHLFDRQVNAAPYGASVNRARKLYEHITPNAHVHHVECPDLYIKKFTEDGQYLVCFSRCQQDIIIFRFKGLSYCTKGEEAPGSALPDMAKSFGSYFTRLYSQRLSSGAELLCKDFCLLVRKGEFAIFASCTKELDPPRDEEGNLQDNSPLVPTNEQTVLHLVRLQDGEVCDRRRFCNHFIQLTYNSGVSLCNNVLTVLCVRKQLIYFIHISKEGLFEDLHTIGDFCTPDDGLRIQSYHMAEQKFLEAQAATRVKHRAGAAHGDHITTPLYSAMLKEAAAQGRLPKASRPQHPTASRILWGADVGGGVGRGEAHGREEVSSAEPLSAAVSVPASNPRRTRPGGGRAGIRPVRAARGDQWVRGGTEARTRRRNGAGPGWVRGGEPPAAAGANAANGAHGLAEPNGEPGAPAAAQESAPEASGAAANMVQAMEVDGEDECDLMATLDDHVPFIRGLKQHFLVFLYHRCKRRGMRLKDQGVNFFFANFNNYAQLMINRVQMLDPRHLLIRYGDTKSLLQRNRMNGQSPQNTVFFVIYDMIAAEILDVWCCNEDRLASHVDRFADYFVATPETPMWGRYSSTYSNNEHMRWQLRGHQGRSQEDTPSTSAATTAPSHGSVSSGAHLLLQQLLPAAPQGLSPSPFFDHSLFQYDEKLIVGSERPKPCVDFPIKFLSQTKHRKLRFKIDLGYKVGGNEARIKRIVSYVFHPFYPFALSVMMSFLHPQLVNVHMRT